MRGSMGNYMERNTVIIAVLGLLPIIRLLPYSIVISSEIYYPIIVILGGSIIFSYHKELHFGLLTALLIATCIVSSAINIIPALGWKQLAAFTLMLTIYGPLISSQNLEKIRKRILHIMLWGCVGIAIITDITIMLPNQNEGAHFGMLPGDAMILAPACASALIWSVWLISTGACDSHPRKRLLQYIVVTGILLSCAAIVTLSSRIAIAACGCGLSIIGVNQIKHHKVKALAIFGGTIILVSTSFIPLTQEMDAKFDFARENGSFLASRENLWANRMAEMTESPMIGQGFRQMPYSASQFDYFGHAAEQGREESGSSWLYLFSTLGIAGGVIMLVIYVLALMRSLATSATLLAALLVMWGVHMCAEGYLFAAGSPLCVMTWLCIACGLDCEWDSKFTAPR